MHVELRTSYTLQPGMSIEPTPQRTLIHLDNHTLELPPLQEPAAAMLASLTTMPSSDDEIDRSLSTSGARTEVYYALHLLNRWHLVSRRVESSGAGATLRLMAGAEAVPPRITLEGCALRLSRFAYARRRGDELVVESPLAHAMLHLRDAELAPVLALLAARAATADDIAASVGMPRTTAAGTLALLAVGGFMAGGEDDNSTLRQWDFHDFLFHSRCRLGRHDNALGGNFRFKGTLEPQPAIKTTPRGTPIPLRRANVEALMTGDVTLTRALEERQSVRSYSRPITLDELGEFLHRVARVKETFENEYGQFTKRPYPSGGASYELELYLTVDQCSSLTPGMYYYAPVDHALYLVRPADHETEGLLTEAWWATARLCRPQVLITIAARFQRVAWKYDSMAYATILKNTGVLYQTMYLVATAMGLAPCGLGSGNSDRFARAAGTDYAAESSVGEFALGAR